MTSDEKTQDEPIMDGATEATASEKLHGKNEQDTGDAAVGSDLDDSVRSIRAVGEDKTVEGVNGE